jgi:hypothetical protein
MKDYIISYRHFTGPGYWGSFKHTKAFNDNHAQQKLKRVVDGYLRKHGPVNGEFRIQQMEGEPLYFVLLALGQRAVSNVP